MRQNYECQIINQQTIKEMKAVKTVFWEACRRLEEGAGFSIDFKAKSMKVGKKQYIKNGKFDRSVFDGLYVDRYKTSGGKTPLESIRHYYTLYRNSVPSEKSMSVRSGYFTALTLEQLSDDDMMYGLNRDLARFRLEFYVLMCIIERWIDWNGLAGNKWFWASEDCPGLILLKEWFE